MCEDGNAQCALWALRGECTKNPVYMLYHCKASCGVCSGAHPPFLLPANPERRQDTRLAVARHSPLLRS